MKNSRSSRTVFLLRIIFVGAVLILTALACIFGHLAVSTAKGELGNYLPDTYHANVLRAILATVPACAVALVIAERIILSVKKSNTATGSCHDAESESDDTQSDSADITAHTARCSQQKIICISLEYATKLISLFPAAVAGYIFYFALSVESLGSWGNPIMFSALVSALFFLFGNFRRAPLARVICGIGIFALSTLIITSLYLDLVIELNSDFKLLVQFAAAGMILGTIADIRSSLSRISPRWFIALKSTALILCASTASVLLSVRQIDSGLFPTHYFVYSSLFLAYAVLTAFELITTAVLCEKSYI